MTVLVKDPRATFIHIPKTGGVSISQWLTRNVKGEYLLDKQHGGKHADQTRIAKFLKLKQQPMGYTFCVVRNPWDRVVSAYHYYLRRKAIDKNISFEDFLRGQWNKSKGNIWGCATKQMHEYYYDVDVILRFENLNEDFKVIQEFFGRDQSLSKNNTSNHKDFRTYYTPEMVDIVAKKHAKDIQLYNYSFE